MANFSREGEKASLFPSRLGNGFYVVERVVGKVAQGQVHRNECAHHDGETLGVDAFWSFHCLDDVKRSRVGRGSFSTKRWTDYSLLSKGLTRSLLSYSCVKPPN